jgi:hypothetical protein
MGAVFADLKTDFVLKKVLGAEEHKDLLIALLNALGNRASNGAPSSARIRSGLQISHYPIVAVAGGSARSPGVAAGEPGELAGAGASWRGGWRGGG